MDEIQVDYLNDIEYKMQKKIKNDIYLSQEQMDILDEYNIDYRNCNTLSELIMIVSNVYDNCEDDVLNNLLDILCESNYYQNFNK